MRDALCAARLRGCTGLSGTFFRWQAWLRETLRLWRGEYPPELLEFLDLGGPRGGGVGGAHAPPAVSKAASCDELL